MSEKVRKASSVGRSWLFVAILGAAVMLAACGGEPTIDPLEIGDPERGRDIFETGGGVISGNCAVCHSMDGSVGAPPNGPSLQGIAERANDRVPELSAVEYLRQSIVDPSAYLVEGFDDNMAKGFRILLSEEDIDDLIAFLLTQ